MEEIQTVRRGRPMSVPPQLKIKQINKPFKCMHCLKFQDRSMQVNKLKVCSDCRIAHYQGVYNKTNENKKGLDKLLFGLDQSPLLHECNIHRFDKFAKFHRKFNECFPQLKQDYRTLYYYKEELMAWCPFAVLSNR